MNRFEKLLSGGDLRSIGKNNSVIKKIKNQTDFDELFKYLFHANRIVVMRAADAIEKVTATNLNYLGTHKPEIFTLCSTAKNKELLWHLAQLIPRMSLSYEEFIKAWKMLSSWTFDKSNSRIVRVCAIQSLYDLSKQQQNLMTDLNTIMFEIEKENIPSLNARLRLIRKEISRG